MACASCRNLTSSSFSLSWLTCASFRSTDAWERVADEHVHDAAPAERGLDDDEPRLICPHLADLSRASAAGRGAQRRQRVRRRLGGDERDEAPLVRDVHRTDAE